MTLQTIDGKRLSEVEDFLYLGSWIKSCEKDISVRTTKVWTALRKMDTIWKSKLQPQLKISFFKMTVQSVLLYGSSSWTLTKTLEKKIDGAYTKMLRVVKGISWSQHLKNAQLYGDLPKISDTIREQRTRFSGHCWGSKEEVISNVLLWQPSHGKRSRRRPS